jgi:hypothetical protein
VWELSRRPGEETFAIGEDALYLKLAALSRHRSQFTLASAEPFKGPGYITFGGHDVHPDTVRYLAPYRELFEYESYVRASVPATITPDVGYTTSRERELVS